MLREEHERVAREEWFEEIVGLDYQNEIEVEVKFILPLAKFLGYHEKDVGLRVPVTLQMGHQTATGTADWVLWSKKTDSRSRLARVVIEAKKSDASLDRAVQMQARSYALGLNAPYYVIANGRRLRVFERKIQDDDECVVDCRARELMSTWPVIYEMLGAGRGTQAEEG